MPEHMFKSTGSDWDAHAAEYASSIKEGPMLAPIRAILRHLNAAAPFNSASTIADMGCGSGLVMEELLTTYGSEIPPSARLIASDFSKGMVEQVNKLKARHEDSQLWQRLETHVWDLQDLGTVAENSISHMSANCVFFMTGDPQKSLREAYRVLGKDGVLAQSSWSRIEWVDYIEAASEAVRPDLRGIMKRFELPKRWKTTEDVTEQMEEAGFIDVKAEYVNASLDVENPESLLMWFIKSKNPVIVQMLDGFSKDDVDNVCLEFKNMVERNFPAGQRKLKGVAVIVSGRK